MRLVPVPAAYALALTAAMNAVAQTQTLDEFDAWMQAIDQKTQTVQQSIAKKDAAAVAADAAVLQTEFARVEAFFTGRENSADAVELAREARARAGDVATAAAARDFDTASSQAIKVAGTCTACHRLYRPLP